MIARQLGEGFKFYRNYIPGEMADETSSLEFLKRKGGIEDYRVDQPAFGYYGNKIDYARAIYIKFKPR